MVSFQHQIGAVLDLFCPSFKIRSQEGASGRGALLARDDGAGAAAGGAGEADLRAYGRLAQLGQGDRLFGGYSCNDRYGFFSGGDRAAGGRLL